MNLKGLWMLIKDTFVQWIDDNPFQMAAALAYYTLFCMAPLLMIAIAGPLQPSFLRLPLISLVELTLLLI
jgi:uncharacterized BrkB/YihY/UPF0761 family membrane protein